MILPPKRWERSEDPKYDPIRHHAWFARLEKRKYIIPQMEVGYKYLKDNPSKTQKEVCEQLGLRDREFQDFIQFMDGYSRHDNLPDNLRVTYQKILDDAYSTYCYRSGMLSFRKAIDLVAPAYGVRPRIVCELWEVDPEFYPLNYR